MSIVLGSEKMKIDDDDGLLKVWADHEEARWGKGAVAILWGGAFSRRVAPKQVVEVEVEGNICGRWQFLNRGLLMYSTQGVKKDGSTGKQCLVLQYKGRKREEMRGEGADLQTIKGLPF
jgi:hypothetical protein